MSRCGAPKKRGGTRAEVAARIRNRERAKTKYDARMAWARVRLGGKCELCHSTNKLEFDHTNPKTKRFDISHGYTKPIEVFAAEVDACRLLCRSCHRRHTMLQRMQLSESPIELEAHTFNDIPF